MEFTATQKFLRVSPKKVRPVVLAIKKMSPIEALKVLPFVGQVGAEPLSKVIKTALANALQKEVNASDLVFGEIQIGEGPRLKRGRIGSRGRTKPYKRRMSHIRVVLKTKDESKELALETKSKSVEVKKEAKVLSSKKSSSKVKKSPVVSKKGIKKSGTKS